MTFGSWKQAAIAWVASHGTEQSLIPVPTPMHRYEEITVGADGGLWFTENVANKIGRIAPDGTVIGEYDIPTAESGARCITSMSDGHLFFTQYDAGLIGEIIVG